MQTTSALWNELFNLDGTSHEYKFEIDGVTYGQDALVSQSVEAQLYEEFGIGNATTAKLTLTLIADNIPRGATVKRFIRLVNGDRTSEWLQKGIYFINRRGEEDGQWTIEAFDIMRKAEVVWSPSQSAVFPMSMKDAVDIYAEIMGCEIDPRTSINPAYTLDYPTNDYTIREELQFIAAAHGGNWIVTDEGKLLLVPLISFPDETHYLVEERGAAITFAGVRILV